MLYLSAFEEWLRDIEPTLMGWLVKLVIALVLLLLARIGSNWSARATSRVLRHAKLSAGAERLLVRAVRLATLVAAITAILFLFGLEGLATSFLAGLGVSGLILGFALQDITKNLAAGLLLLFQRPFEIGDRILVANIEGFVTDISMRDTRIRTLNNEDVFIPNATVFTGVITNLSRYRVRRSSLTLTLKADVPLDEALQALESAVLEVDGVAKNPEPQALVTDVAGPVGVELRFWMPAATDSEPVLRSRVARRVRALVNEREWINV